MFRYNRKTQSFDSHYNTKTTNKLSFDHISAFVQDKNGILWIATDGGGLNSLDPETRQILHYKSGNETNKAAQLSNNEDTLGNIWLGGFSGLYCIDKTSGEITQRTTLDRLPDNLINGIEMDDEQRLWLSTGNGLCRYNPENDTYMNFYAKDGIQSNEFRRGSHFKGKNNRLYFGGINGLTHFTPPYPAQDNPLLHLAFTDLLIYNAQVQVGKSSVLKKSLDESESIHLKYNQRSFTFRFAALEYSMPQRVLY